MPLFCAPGNNYSESDEPRKEEINRQDAKNTKKETDEERTADDADGRRWGGNHGIHGKGRERSHGGENHG